MVFKKFFTKTTMSHTIRTYFGTAWEFWKREVTNTLWDWGIDGPFCSDQSCGQRLLPSTKNNQWKCIRCGAQRVLPKTDLIAMREQAIRFFEEEMRENNEAVLGW